MGKVNTMEIYTQLRGYLCKRIATPDVDWLKFTEKTNIVQFKANEVIVESGQPSIHSYFIISGLIMCHQPHEPKDHIFWIRAENDYAFTTESLGFNKDRKYTEQLIALEDTVAVSISHEDKAELMKNGHEISNMLGDTFIATAIRFGRLTDSHRYPKENRYGFVQENIGFSLNRVPDGYLAAYLGITVKKLKEVREAIEK